MAKINVQQTDVTILTINDNDYISLTDMAHSQMEEHIIIKWLSLKSTIEYIGEWEAGSHKKCTSSLKFLLFTPHKVVI